MGLLIGQRYQARRITNGLTLSRAVDRVVNPEAEIFESATKSQSPFRNLSMQLLFRSHWNHASMKYRMGHTLIRPCAGFGHAGVPQVLRREKSSEPAYEGHIPLNCLENVFLAVGSAVMALYNPRRGGKCSSMILI